MNMFSPNQCVRISSDRALENTGLAQEKGIVVQDLDLMVKVIMTSGEKIGTTQCFLKQQLN